MPSPNAIFLTGTTRNAVPATSRFALAVVAALILATVTACSSRVKPLPPVTRYQALPPKDVPAYMKNSIFERSDLVDLDPLVISGYGLVVNLNNTGDNTQIPTNVREYMIREMVKRGFGSKLMPGFERTGPEEVLRDPRTAIVRVDAVVPPGARRGDFVDARVSALPTSTTTSLAHGELYRTELKIGGANAVAPGATVNVIAMAEGSLLLNPAYALSTSHDDPSARRSLRSGWVLDGAQLREPRPLMIRLRQPDRRIARLIEARIDNRFAEYKEAQRDKIASAQDEAIIRVTIPPLYRGDWQHFSGVLMHLYFETSPAFITTKAQELAAAAVEPGAPLLDISYAWEGLGPTALPFISPLMTHERPDVAYAAARAAAFLEDPSAPEALAAMARTSGHPFQLNAVQTLGELPASPILSEMLRTLLNGDQTTVRVEAYRALVRHRDRALNSRVVNERFVLDVIECEGTPLVYATRTGLPRIALIGPRTAVQQPFSFTAMDDRLTLMGDGANRGVTIYYRSPSRIEPARVASRSDLAEIISRLGGDSAAGPAKLSFNYGEVIAVLQAMADRRQIVAGNGTPATFVLQQSSALEESLFEAPAIPEQSRPAGGENDVPVIPEQLRPPGAKDQ